MYGDLFAFYENSSLAKKKKKRKPFCVDKQVYVYMEGGVLNRSYL